MSQLGFTTIIGHDRLNGFGLVERLGGTDPLGYPFNQMNFYWTKKGLIIIAINGTRYSCNTLKKLLSSVYFAGAYKGMEDKKMEIQKTLGITKEK